MRNGIKIRELLINYRKTHNSMNGFCFLAKNPYFPQLKPNNKGFGLMLIEIQMTFSFIRTQFV